MTDDHYINSADRRRWAGVSVINGWVIFNGRTQLGFALSRAWTPGQERNARGSHAREQVQDMGLPQPITEWLRNLLHYGLVDSVSIQFTGGDRWHVNISSPLSHMESAKVEAIVEGLHVAANLPLGSPGQRVTEIGAILGDGKFYSELDATAQWLGGRIQQAVQSIFGFSGR